MKESTDSRGRSLCVPPVADGADGSPLRCFQTIPDAAYPVTMIRALFFGLGAFVGLWGLSLIAVDGVLLHQSAVAQQNELIELVSSPAADGRRLIDPPDWIGFTLVGMGGLTLLYSVALPRS